MVPDHETVKQIMNEAYNKFYLKWRMEMSESNIDTMMQEAHEISHKFNCELCNNLMANLVTCIEEEWRRRQGL